MKQSLFVEAIHAFNDNYIWAIRWNQRDFCILIDPGDAQAALRYLSDNKLRLLAIWNTHHHQDHTGGNSELKHRYACPVLGSQEDKRRISGLDQGLVHGDSFMIPGDEVLVISTPGHTMGAVCFLLRGSSALFCGDTLFSMGCGRMFEGTPEVYWKSLKTLRNLPSATELFCAHEYTLDNGAFALNLTPGDRELAAYIERLRDRSCQKGRTLPVLLRDELRFNPFLRVDQPDFVASLPFETRGLGEGDVFAQIRLMKDHM
ncbi:MAG: hydroxyacylglutathione hydrolase [Deltaproteobacteria bacterium]|nr:hydroxyacylglutathione hydrolase [Deltaproteobacteria bacterium]